MHRIWAIIERDLRRFRRSPVLVVVSIIMPLVQLVAEERTLKGSYIGTCVPARDIPRYVALYRAGRLPVNRLMSGVLALEDINEGFDRLHDGHAVRQVITFPA